MSWRYLWEVRPIWDIWDINKGTVYYLELVCWPNALMMGFQVNNWAYESTNTVRLSFLKSCCDDVIIFYDPKLIACGEVSFWLEVNRNMRMPFCFDLFNCNSFVVEDESFDFGRNTLLFKAQRCGILTNLLVQLPSMCCLGEFKIIWQAIMIMEQFCSQFWKIGFSHVRIPK